MTPTPGSQKTTNLTLELCHMLAGWPAREPHVLDTCALLLLDGIAIGVAGATSEVSRLVTAVTMREESAPVAIILGTHFATSLRSAARLNGIAMHARDFEPMWDPANHAISPILPALLAIAERRESEGHGPQGKALLQALAKGIELQGRIRRASNQRTVSQLSFHPPGVVGPLASAYGCSQLLDLDPTTTAAALAIAASSCGGLIANIPTMTNALHCGDAAAIGLDAALLAKDGVTACPDILGDPHGYALTYHGGRFEEAQLIAYPTDPVVVRPGPAWKFYPTQYATHFAIEAALSCRSRMEADQTIVGVQVTAPAMPHLDKPHPANAHQAKYSLQYCTVAALLDGAVTEASFAPARLQGRDMIQLLSKTTLIQAPDIPADFSSMWIDVDIAFSDGATGHHRCGAPEGSWARPAAPDRIRQKARTLLSAHLPAENAEAILALLGGPVESLSITSLMRLGALQGT